MRASAARKSRRPWLVVFWFSVRISCRLLGWNEFHGLVLVARKALVDKPLARPTAIPKTARLALVTHVEHVVLVAVGAAIDFKEFGSAASGAFEVWHDWFAFV